jgi:hypothetical protein
MATDVQPCADDVVRFLQLFLRHPLLAAALAPVVAMLFGAGRRFGLPLLFWHERPARQALAGLAATLLAAEVFFVTYLLAGQECFPGALGLLRFMSYGGVVWGGIVGAAVVCWLARRTPPRAGDTRGLTPGIRAVHAGRPGPLRAVQPPMWPFLAGAAVGVLAVDGLTWVGAWLPSDSGPVTAALIRWHLVPKHDLALHLFAAIIFLGVLGGYVVGRWIATPAVGLCLLLSLVAAVYGFFAFHLASAGVAIVVVVSPLLVAGLPRYKIRVPALADRYTSPSRYPPDERATAAARTRLLDARRRVERPEPRPLVVVCAGGGGIRAATWTAAVLEQLDRLPDFVRAVRLVTGASGGIVGAAFWVTRHYERLAGRPSAMEALPRLVARDSLGALAHRLVFRDVPFALLPAVNAHDRGRAMEDAWRRLPAGSLAVPIGALREHEERGELPSLVFTPMLVEDGRRLVIGNVDLSRATASYVRWIGGATPEAASVSAVHLEELFPGALRAFPLATAARLSASFPYVTPAAVLPTVPRRRVVDAGYYDNYGLALACEWLRDCVETEPAWLERHVSRVLVIQIRDEVSELSVHETGASPGARSTPWGRGFEWLTSPIAGMLAAREAVMLFRNDAALAGVTAALGPGFVTTTVFEFKGEASLSWYLTAAETDTICAQVASPGIAAKVAAVGEWLAR